MHVSDIIGSMKKNKNALLIGNWKTNPGTLAEAKKRFQAIKKAALKYKGIEAVICPPFPFISSLSDSSGKKGKQRVAVGSQDVSIFEEGLSKTGEVSAKMVESAGASYAIIGHSERRQLGDTGQSIALKVGQALKTGMHIVLCVGEKDRDGDGGYLEVIKAQLKEALVHVGRSEFHKIIIAYEPVWAIGRKDNVALTSYDLHQMVVYIKKFLKETWGDTISSMTRVLYGGSVTPSNAEDIMWNGEVDGLLIGRASWEADSFGGIFEAISSAEKTRDSGAFNKKALKKTLAKAKNDKQNAQKARDAKKRR